MKAEEYEAAVNALLEALGLDAGLTLEVRVQPHQATAKVLLTTDNVAGEVKGVEGIVYTDVVVKRDDTKADTAHAIAAYEEFKANGGNLAERGALSKAMSEYKKRIQK